MTEWAAKVLEGVPRFDHYDDEYEAKEQGAWVTYAAALAAIAKLAEGDGLVERLLVRDPVCEEHHTSNEAAARIAELVEGCNQLEAMARGYAEELAALRAKVARLEGALGGVSASLHQLARDRDLSEAELDFMRGIDAALTDGGK